MTQDEALRLWAYQWVMSGERPRDLPQDVKFEQLFLNTQALSYGGSDVELREFVIDHGATTSICRIAYVETTHGKVFFATAPDVVSAGSMTIGNADGLRMVIDSQSQRVYDKDRLVWPKVDNKQ